MAAGTLRAIAPRRGPAADPGDGFDMMARRNGDVLGPSIANRSGASTQPHGDRRAVGKFPRAGRAAAVR